MGVGRNGTVRTGAAGCGDVAGKGGCGADSRSASITVGGTGGVEMGAGKACICVASHSKPRCAANTSSAGCALRRMAAPGTVRCGERGRDDSMTLAALRGLALKKAGV